MVRFLLILMVVLGGGSMLVMKLSDEALKARAKPAAGPLTFVREQKQGPLIFQWWKWSNGGLGDRCYLVTRVSDTAVTQSEVPEFQCE